MSDDTVKQVRDLQAQILAKLSDMKVKASAQANQSPVTATEAGLNEEVDPKTTMIMDRVKTVEIGDLIMSVSGAKRTVMQVDDNFIMVRRELGNNMSNDRLTFKHIELHGKRWITEIIHDKQIDKFEPVPESEWEDDEHEHKVGESAHEHAAKSQLSDSEKRKSLVRNLKNARVGDVIMSVSNTKRTVIDLTEDFLIVLRDDGHNKTEETITFDQIDGSAYGWLTKVIKKKEDTEEVSEQRDDIEKIEIAAKDQDDMDMILDKIKTNF